MAPEIEPKSECEHLRVEFNRAEPDLGYSAYYMCLDCDETTTEWERDGDEDGEWIVPIWED